MIGELMLARIGSIWFDGTEDFNDVGWIKDKIDILQGVYKELESFGLLYEGMPHYIDVEYPVEYLEYCLTLPLYTDTIHSHL